VGRYACQATQRRWGRYVWLRDEDVDRATRWFDRYGAAAVFLGRMPPVVRTFISLPAGFANMAPVRFGVYTLAGCVPWTAALGVAGYAVGRNWQRVADDFHGPTYVIAGVVGIGALVLRGPLPPATAPRTGQPARRRRPGLPRPYARPTTYDAADR
jgi:membrane protein DedA with SNARE-associated domain